MNNHLLPFLGGREIAEISPAEILPILQRLAERENFEMLARIRSIMSQIFRFGERQADAPATQPTRRGRDHHAEKAPLPQS